MLIKPVRPKSLNLNFYRLPVRGCQDQRPGGGRPGRRLALLLCLGRGPRLYDCSETSSQVKVSDDKTPEICSPEVTLKAIEMKQPIESKQ